MEEIDLTNIDYDSILAKVDEIREYFNTHSVTRIELETKYKSFFEAYPALFNKCLEPGFNRHQLVYAIDLLKKVQCGSMQKHDADIAFGQATMDCVDVEG